MYIKFRLFTDRREKNLQMHENVTAIIEWHGLNNEYAILAQFISDSANLCK